MSDSEILLTEVCDGVATVTLNRPNVLNALNNDMRRGLTGVLTRLNEDDGVRVIVLQGAGRAFCAGQDQKESKAFSRERASERIQAYGELFDTLRRTFKPVVSKIHGYSVGAGFQVALHSDLRIAAESAKVGLTELNIGAPCITGSGAMWPVAGAAVVKELVLTGAFVEARRAFELGLLTEVVPEERLAERVDEIVATLKEKPPLAVRITKQFWQRLTEADFRATMEFAASGHAESFESGELVEGATRFAERKTAAQG